jgi:hypothetical protein
MVEDSGRGTAILLRGLKRDAGVLPKCRRFFFAKMFFSQKADNTAMLAAVLKSLM